MYTEKARAKINLNLHVGRLIDDPTHKYYGYHPLSSLVVFADYGDELSCDIANETSLTISGAFAKGLETDENNLVLKAFKAVTARADLPPLSFHLIKNLPIASGIGGGSADAAAVLRLLQNYIDLSDETWLEIALSLGADVPVCFHSKTCFMSGIGEKIEFFPGQSPLPALLINPGIPVSTGTMFQALDATIPDPIPKGQNPKSDILAQALAGRNDFEPLFKHEDLIGFEDDLDFVSQKRLLRLSGTGATFFVIYATKEEAHIAGQELKSLWEKTRPHWWIQPVMLGDLS